MYAVQGLHSLFVTCPCAALLNITPSDNNGTFGALHHMLMQNLSDILPPGMHIGTMKLCNCIDSYYSIYILL